MHIHLQKVGNLSKLTLKVADVGLEAITLPHFDREEVVVALFTLPVGSVLSEECLSYLLKIIGRMWMQKVEPIWSHTFQAGWKGQPYEGVITRADYHLIPEMSDVLNWVAHSIVIVEY